MKARWFLLPLLIMGLASCLPAETPPLAAGIELPEREQAKREITPSALPTSTREAATTAAPWPENTPAPQQTMTPEAGTCSEDEGTLLNFSLSSRVLSRPLSGSLYLPPCYDAQRPGGYPVLYLLHGIYETDHQWVDLELPQQVDSLLAGGEIPPLLIVMPREENWETPPRNRFGEAVVQDLIPWVDENYHTSPEREKRAVGGVSRGGNWALRLGLLSWDKFGAVGVHSAPLFYGDVRKIEDWVEQVPAGNLPLFYLDIGEDDQQGEYVREVEEEFNRLGVVHAWHLFPGLHNNDYWRAHLADYLRWYTRNW